MQNMYCAVGGIKGAICITHLTQYQHLCIGDIKGAICIM